MTKSGFVEKSYEEKDDQVKALKDSRSSGDFNDVKIELNDGESLYAMKGILAARSEYFATLFRFNNYSNPEDTKSPTVVKVPCSKKVMNTVLDCLYGVEVKYKILDVLESLEYLEMLRMMMMAKAYNHLEESIRSNLRDKNFLPLHLRLKVLDMSLKHKFCKISNSIITNFGFSSFLEAVEEDTEGALTGWTTEVSKETILILLERKISIGQRQVWLRLDDSPRLRFYSLWIKGEGNQLTEEEAIRLSATFDLKNFTSIEELLSKEVVECGFFALEDIHKAVLERYKKDVKETINPATPVQVQPLERQRARLPGLQPLQALNQRQQDNRAKIRSIRALLEM